ncbi:CCR4-associated factor Not3 isoform X2 [Rhipicephalus microplus]|uniref:CCR4-associated factor Not3 isoform X2 n=1 Tax=Rhipicephalus microplus TaxID=6941 RepID=UPI003F6B0394
MADRRKLQGEIERCLKKVTEGVEQFEDIWQKVYNATNTNQKEKYEADLKKEIKKLQRLRDQIKTWMASSEIKDKRILMDNRKLIETQMERFKVVERETKTKAYSKEGLGGAQKVDPAQKEKEDITIWLSNSIASLNIHVDQFESELESLTIGVKKKKNDNQDRVDELKTLLSRHRYHILQLETLMRMLDNGTVEVCKIKKIKEDVEYYIESCQDPDFEENEFLYDDLDLRDMADFLTKASAATTGLEHADNCILDSATPNANDEVPGAETPASTNSSSPVPSPGLTNHSRSSESSQVVKTARSVVANSGVVNATVNSKAPAPITSRNNSTSSQSSSNSSPSVNSHQNHAVVSPPLTPYAVAAAANAKGTPSPPPSTAPSIDGAATVDHQGHFHRAPSPTQHNSTNATTNNSGSQQLAHSGPTLADHGSTVSSAAASLYASLASSQGRPSSPTAPSILHMNGPMVDKSGDSMSSLKSIAEQAVLNAGLEGRLQSPSSQQQQQQQQQQQLQQSSLQQSLQTLQQQQQQQQQQVQSSSCERSMFESVVGSKEVPRPQQQQQQQPAPTAEAHIPPLRGVAPLGPAPLSKECFYQLRLLEAASMHMPHPSDSERLRPYLPRNPTQVPSYYPQTLPHCDTVEFFQKLSTETLFFVFYYMEGSKAQYLAAKALKKQSWRFHTKYMMWFQRHEEPKTITDEYEQGTYIYFDYEKWSQRRKEGFTFEYRYLEDRDLN